MKIIVLFGPPGSGKGTQAKVLAEKFNLKHISTGDLFRYNIKNDTELGKKVKSILEQGNLVPDEITTAMLKDELLRSKDEKGFILDGYPRNTEQAVELDKLLKKLFDKEVNVTLALDVEDELLVERIKNRAIESNRPDDADENIIRNRIKVYYDETSPVSNHYKKQNKWIDINGVGNVSEITQMLVSEIEKI